MKSLSFVFPAYNEEKNIANTIRTAYSVGKYFKIPFEIIVVNDGSQDKTEDILLELKKEFPDHLRLVNHHRNEGYGSTLKDGFAKAKNEWIFFSDSDGQFDLWELQKFTTYTEHFDVIAGNRKKRKDPFIRLVNAFLFKLMVKQFFHIKIKDIDCAFKLIRSSSIKSMSLLTNGAMVNTELLYKLNLANARIKELDVSHRQRIYGSSTGGNPKVILKAMKEFLYLLSNY